MAFDWNKLLGGVEDDPTDPRPKLLRRPFAQGGAQGATVTPRAPGTATWNPSDIVTQNPAAQGAGSLMQAEAGKIQGQANQRHLDLNGFPIQQNPSGSSGNTWATSSWETPEERYAHLRDQTGFARPAEVGAIQRTRAQMEMAGVRPPQIGTVVPNSVGDQALGYELPAPKPGEMNKFIPSELAKNPAQGPGGQQQQQAGSTAPPLPENKPVQAQQTPSGQLDPTQTTAPVGGPEIAHAIGQFLHHLFGGGQRQPNEALGMF